MGTRFFLQYVYKKNQIMTIEYDYMEMLEKQINIAQKVIKF